MKLAKTLAIVACAGLLSASLACAQDTAAQADGGGQGAGPPATAQPDKKSPPPPPFDFQGCWDGSSTNGSLVDNFYGDGYGWIGITQSGKNFKESRSYYSFVWGNGAFANGPIKGKATATGFTATFFAGKCKGTIIGSPGGSDNIVGTYNFDNPKCQKHDAGLMAEGSFKLPLNNSGCTAVLTPP